MEETTSNGTLKVIDLLSGGWYTLNYPVKLERYTENTLLVIGIYDSYVAGAVCVTAHHDYKGAVTILYGELVILEGHAHEVTNGVSNE